MGPQGVCAHASRDLTPCLLLDICNQSINSKQWVVGGSMDSFVVDGNAYAPGKVEATNKHRQQRLSFGHIHH